MDDFKSTSFSSFLAGFLLVKKNISNMELANGICLFEEQLNYCIVDGDLYRLYGIIYRDDNGFYLSKDYNDKYNDICTVKEYLYSMTNPEIRNFFGYQEEVNIDMNINKKKSFLSKIRTRFSH